MLSSTCEGCHLLGTFFAYHLIQWINANEISVSNAMNPANDPRYCCAPGVNASEPVRIAAMCPVLEPPGCPGVATDDNLTVNSLFIYRMIFIIVITLALIGELVVVFVIIRMYSEGGDATTAKATDSKKQPLAAQMHPRGVRRGGDGRRHVPRVARNRREFSAVPITRGTIGGSGGGGAAAPRR